MEYVRKMFQKKPKVWFKKQKYHCIYEYPKEPESPVFQKEVQWHNDLRTFQGESFIFVLWLKFTQEIRLKISLSVLFIFLIAV